MIIRSMGYKTLYIQLCFLYIYRIYILLQFLKMVGVAIELLCFVGLMDRGVVQYY